MAKKHIKSPPPLSQKGLKEPLASSSPSMVKKGDNPIIAAPTTSSESISAPSRNGIPSAQSAQQPQAPNSSEANSIPSTKMPAIKLDQISLALKTLIDYSNKTMKKKMDDGEMFADDVGTNDCFVNLVISLKRIPSRERHMPARINLTHPLIDPRVSPVCLIVKDPQREYKDLLEENKIKFISKVVGITKLRGKHSPFEARRLLLSSHALFLADERVLPMLPTILGVKFFKSKKLPLPVTLTNPRKIKAELEKVISSTYLRLGTGSCVNIKIGDLSRHNEAELKENLIQVLEQLGKKIPMGGWANIQGVHIKTGTSISLPIWLSELNSEGFGRFNLTPTPAEQERIKAFEQKKKASLEVRARAKVNNKRKMNESIDQAERSEAKTVSDVKAEMSEPKPTKEGTELEESDTAPPKTEASEADPESEEPSSRPKKRKQKKQVTESSELLAPESASNLTNQSVPSQPKKIKKDKLKSEQKSAQQARASVDLEASTQTSIKAVAASQPIATSETAKTPSPSKAKKSKKDKPEIVEKQANSAAEKEASLKKDKSSKKPASGAQDEPNSKKGKPRSSVGTDKEASTKKDKSSKKPASGAKDEVNSKGKPRSSVGEKVRGLGKVKVEGTVSKKA